MKRFITIALIVVMLFSCVACKGKTKGDEEFQFTSYDLVKDGASDYSVLVPANADENALYAASELIWFFREATGVTLGILRDDGSYNENSKCISIGETPLFLAQNVEVDMDALEWDGYRIFRKESNLFIVGGKGKGDIYGVYEFMERNFGVKVYAEDEILVPAARDMKLLDIDLTETPDIATRAFTSYQATYKSEQLRTRMRLNGNQENWIYFSHSTFLILPKETYYNDHRDWYSTDSTQLCLTNEEMTQEFIKNTVDLVRANPDDRFIMLGLEDVNTFCECENCAAQVREVKESGVMLRFVNKVAKAVNEFIAENQPGREFYVVFYAYYKTEDPPVKYENGKYAVLAPDLTPEDNVAVMFAPLYADFSHSLMDGTYNASCSERLQGWKAIFSDGNLFARYYAAQFGYYFVPFNNWPALQENYKLLKDIGCPYVYNQGAHSANTGNFQEMTLWVNSQLMWDTDQNTNELIDEFIDVYYKDAAEEISEYFGLLRAHYAILQVENGLYAYPTMSYRDLYKTAEVWPREFLLQALSLFDSALEKLEPLGTADPAMYEKLSMRVRVERLTPIYFILELYSAYYTEADLREMINEFETVTSARGMLYWAEENASEDRSISTLISGWKNNLL